MHVIAPPKIPLESSRYFAYTSAHVLGRITTLRCNLGPVTSRRGKDAQVSVQAFKREPLTQGEATRPANACETPLERLIVWTLPDTGLRVSELAGLKAENIDWQGRQLIVYGKGGPFGSRSKRRVMPMSRCVRPLVEAHFGLYETLGVGVRTIQRMVKKVANKAKIARNVTPHIGRHTHVVTALQRGISLPSLQHVLGHDNIGTTAIYLNISGEEAAREYRDKW